MSNDAIDSSARPHNTDPVRASDVELVRPVRHSGHLRGGTPKEIGCFLLGFATSKSPNRAGQTQTDPELRAEHNHPDPDAKGPKQNFDNFKNI